MDCLRVCARGGNPLPVPPREERRVLTVIPEGSPIPENPGDAHAAGAEPPGASHQYT
jgi:hypothetical protein